jgi:uncharacterized protein (TIGR03437 family)
MFAQPTENAMKATIPLIPKVLISLLLPLALGWGQSLSVVNAASGQPSSIAPGSIVTIFGTNMTTGVGIASSASNPPTSLGGTTVTVGGSVASLFFTSASQINAVVNPATPTGTQNLVVTSSTGTQQVSVVIDKNAPPGLFSLNGLGTGDGAFVNALTALLGPFTPGTTNGTTYLELFLTDLNLSFAPTVSIGGVSANVLFYGASPCCAGLYQINIQVPLSVAGAGRVPVVVTDNGQASNTVDIVLLPPNSQHEFSDDQDDHARSRELASLASVPGTSLVLSSDENDDVVRVIDVSAKSVTKVIALSDGAAPDGIAVNSTGTIAVVTERGLGNAAIINLATMTLTSEISTGAMGAPVSVAIAGKQAVVVNRDLRTVSVIDITTGTVTRTLSVGHGPCGVAVDAAGNKAYVTNEGDGTISVIDLTGLTVSSTLTVGTNLRIEGIVVLPTAGVALVTAPGSQQVFLVNLSTGVATAFTASPAGIGSTDIAVLNSNIYFANQAGGSVSVLPFNPVTGAATGSITSIKVDLGPRALAIDVKDNLLVVSNEGTGTLVLIDLGSNTIAGRINAVRSNSQGDDNGDDHSDHDGAPGTLPSVVSVSPVTGKAGTSFTMTLTGTGLKGATGVQFVNAVNVHGKSPDSLVESAFTATNITVNAGGTQVTATITIAAPATLGPRIVRVVTPTGSSSLVVSSGDTFTVQ